MKLNIRPFTDALRGTGHPWRKLGDNRLGGERLVTFGCLFRGNTEVDSPAAWAADRWLTIQLWGDGNHRVSHMFVTCDCPRDEDGCPQRLRGLTRPTDFKTPAEMLIAIQVELLRGDHTPPPFGLFGAPLDQRTSMLVDRFAFALKEKLLESQSKYGWTDHWAKDNWQDRCTQSLLEHLAKGDPRDVAAFAAFMWHHGWSTRPAPKAGWLVEEEADCPPHCCCCGPGEPCCDCGQIRPSDACLGEKCWCGSPAVKKVGEEILFDDPEPARHNLTTYVCAAHYVQMMGGAGAKQIGVDADRILTALKDRDVVLEEAAKVADEYAEGTPTRYGAQVARNIAHHIRQKLEDYSHKGQADFSIRNLKERV